MYILENGDLKIKVNPHGAELVQAYCGGKEYLWNGNPEFWGRTSPILFPVVGALVQGKYLVNGVEFQLGQHGFTRDMEFALVDFTKTEIWFELVATVETKKVYPFNFTLQIGYVLAGNSVTVKWRVINNDSVTMPFSIGAHPAFITNPALGDYSLHFKDSTTIQTLVFDSSRGLIDVNAKKVEVNPASVLPLNKALFENFPTLILENETEITLKSNHRDHAVEISFDGFPYVGIWSPINENDQIAPFVCIEPWYGLADTATEPRELSEKTGIQVLAPSAMFTAEYTMTFL